jgi:hypothetical protein
MRSPTRTASCLSADIVWTVVRCSRRPFFTSIHRVIYCVVPEALADELFDKLNDYYAEDPNVEVIVDRRKSDRRDRTSSSGGQREVRDRRRPRVPGELPELATE